MNRPSFRIQEKGDFPFLEYLYPESHAPFFIRLFLRGTLMDRTLGNPATARTFAEPLIPRQGPLIAPHQVHGTFMLLGDASYALPERPEGDGVFLDTPCIEGSLRFADCFPVVLASTTPFPWIAIVHSGFKGAVSNITGTVCESLFSSNERHPAATYAWVGPGIGRKHYNRKYNDPWTKKGLSIFSPENRDERSIDVSFDIGGQINRQLTDAGLPPGNICSLPLCTFERRDIFYSYRNGDIKNRLFLLAFLTEEKIPLFHRSSGELCKSTQRVL